MERLRIIVGGFIGLFPTGGAAWDYAQYPLGLKQLGHDVYYIEDTMLYPIYQKDGGAWDDATQCIENLKATMEHFGMDGRWAYRDIASGKSFGMSESQILDCCQSADVFINISCSTYLRDEYLKIPCRILIDSDPMFTQMQYAMEQASAEESKAWTTKQMLENHTHLFTFGENIGNTDCRIPTFDFRWLTTRQPICLSYWKGTSNGHRNKAFTSIMNWSGRKKLLYGDEEWGQKDIEFEKFKSIPSLVRSADFEVVINKPLNKESLFNALEFESLGWSILEPEKVVGNLNAYRQFIINSRAEFAIAKETYVKANSGWFSCRSACYLAAGNPVVAQETSWSKYIPSGKGVFAFDNIPAAIDAVERIMAEPEKQSHAAEEIAHAYFDSNRVLTDMLNKLN
jgi:hypothetical protein